MPVGAILFFVALCVVVLPKLLRWLSAVAGVALLVLGTVWLVEGNTSMEMAVPVHDKWEGGSVGEVVYDTGDDTGFSVGAAAEAVVGAVKKGIEKAIKEKLP